MSLRQLIIFLSSFSCANTTCIVVCCQDSEYRFENITSEQGLTDRIVNDITQDAQGFIWIGSDEGLTRYDGYSCIVYRHETNNLYSVADNEILVCALTVKERCGWVHETD